MNLTPKPQPIDSQPDAAAIRVLTRPSRFQRLIQIQLVLPLTQPDISSRSLLLSIPLTTMSSAAAVAVQSPALDAATAAQLQQVITRALEEDVGSGDVTTESTVPVSCTARATFLAKEDGVLSGIAVANEVFKRVDENIKVKSHTIRGERMQVERVEREQNEGNLILRLCRASVLR